MSSTLKVAVLKVETEKDLFNSEFEKVLKNLSTYLDDDNTNRRVIDAFNNIETSIWFDSFDYDKYFIKDDIFEDTICFLLAKDAKISMVEDKKHNRITSSKKKLTQIPKIPAHCIFIKSKNILLIEESNLAPSIKTLERGIAKYLSGKVKFSTIKRDNILERLKKFVDKIEDIELEDINLAKYLDPKLKDEKSKDKENSDLFNFLKNPNIKITAKLSFESNDDEKSIAVNIFERYLYNKATNKATKELRNIKVKYKNEDDKREIIELYNNLVIFKITVETYHDDISDLLEGEDERIEYSKSIYKSIIKKYYENDED